MGRPVRFYGELKYGPTRYFGRQVELQLKLVAGADGNGWKLLTTHRDFHRERPRFDLGGVAESGFRMYRRPVLDGLTSNRETSTSCRSCW